MLAGREHEGLVLDSAGAQQELPVGHAGQQREVRRDGQHRRAAVERERAVELREAQVVANCEPEADAVDVGDDRLGTGLGAVGLAVADPADVHVEEVDLRVGGDPAAVTVVHNRNVADPVAVAEDGDAAADQVHAVGAGPVRHDLDRRAGVEPLGLVAQAGAVQPGVPLLRQEDHVGAEVGSLRHQRRHVREVARLLGPGLELDAGGSHASKPTPASPASSSASSRKNTTEHAANRMAACSTAIAIAPSCWSSSGEIPQSRGAWT